MIRPAHHGIEIWLCVKPVDFRKPTRTCVGCSPNSPGPSRLATSKRCCRPGSPPPTWPELRSEESSSSHVNDAVPGAYEWPLLSRPAEDECFQIALS